MDPDWPCWDADGRPFDPDRQFGPYAVHVAQFYRHGGLDRHGQRVRVTNYLITTGDGEVRWLYPSLPPDPTLLILY